MNTESYSPCEVTDKKIITYCIEDGSRMSFLFIDQILNGIMNMTTFSSRYAAEKVLQNENLYQLNEEGIRIDPYKLLEERIVEDTKSLTIKVRNGSLQGDALRTFKR